MSSRGSSTPSSARIILAVCSPDKTVDITPTAGAGTEQIANASEQVTFDASVSSDNIAISNYTWTFNDGGQIELYGPAGGPDMVKNKRFVNDPHAMPMFMGTPSHVPNSLPADFVGSFTTEGGMIFVDGFERGNSSAWSSVVP